jgi:hypothetical protein
VRGRNLAGSFQTWEIGACEVGTHAGSFRTWEISPRGEGILAGSDQTWEISACRGWILLAVFRCGEVVRVG